MKGAIYLLPPCLLALFILSRAPPVPLFARLPDSITANSNPSRNDKAKIPPSSSSSSSVCDDACCARRYGTNPPQKVVPISIPGLYHESNNGINVRMAVHASGDIVSNTIAGSRAWETRRTQEILQNLQTSSAASRNGKKAVLLDIGSNIGWFSLVAAYSGYDVIAVEPFEENRQLFKHTLCLAPEEVRKRVAIVPYAFGPSGVGENTTCELWQVPSINRGDTVTTCSAGVNNPALIRNGFLKLATTQLRTLDSLLPSLPSLTSSASKVMKIDVEGFEPLALKGMQKFMQQYPPNIVFTELSIGMIKTAAKSMGYTDEDAKKMPQWYKNHLKGLGYNSLRVERADVDRFDITLTRKLR